MDMMPNQMRGFASACQGLMVNLIGLGLGPTAIALVTDQVYGDDLMLKYSLAIVPPVVLGLGAIMGFLALKPYLTSLDYLNVWSKENEK
jgi:hypothetical protein